MMEYTFDREIVLDGLKKIKAMAKGYSFSEISDITRLSAEEIDNL